MESIRNIYRIGYGPSSSHTMGPRTAAETFLKRFNDASNYQVTLYGSLAATGKGHLTDKAIKEVFTGRKLQIVWKPEIILPRHPNGVKFEAYNKDTLLGDWTAYSIGGGAVVDDSTKTESVEVYPFSNLNDIIKWCNKNGRSYWEFVQEHEEKDIWDYLNEVWKVMKESIHRGLENEGVLPGILNLPRKASSYHVRASSLTGTLRKRALLFSYALAVSEENASGGKIVTAPTCGSCGALPAVLYYQNTEHNFSESKIIKALATAGLIGNVVKKNASISGAECGCQAEIGVACAMASAATTQLFGGTIFQIEYSAEMGLEHHLGLTCDPVAGLVQIPCIERNAFAAGRALNHHVFAILSDGRHRISFDKVVETMKKTGKDIPSLYRETSMGGLALFDGLADE
ncbi:MAG: L-serine ammonia-lyase [Bacteroidales bacterium]|nr:MAG: L-serine ammonia-lyase [Bacteroidales bacterium]